MSRLSQSPKLVVFAGLPGTGKSTLAQHLAKRLDAVYLRVDTVEASILKTGVPRTFETGLAAYIAVRDVAADQLEIGGSVIVDAVNGVTPARLMWSQLARGHKARHFTIEVKCSDEQEHRRRVENRPEATPPLPAPTWNEVCGREYQPWEEPVLTVDALDGVNSNIRQILTYVDELPA